MLYVLLCVYLQECYFQWNPKKYLPSALRSYYWNGTDIVSSGSDSKFEVFVALSSIFSNITPTTKSEMYRWNYEGGWILGVALNSNINVKNKSKEVDGGPFYHSHSSLLNLPRRNSNKPSEFHESIARKCEAIIFHPSEFGDAVVMPLKNTVDILLWVRSLHFKWFTLTETHSQ